MTSSFTSWQIDVETMETETDFILGGSQITADDDCSHEIKIHLLLGRKATKVHLVKAIIFPVVMNGCESIKKAEHKEELMLLNCCVGEGS